MNKLQAAMKDKSAAGWRERKQYYKVGSPMKACYQCGEVVEDDRGKPRWITGMQVFRSYRPWEIGWTFKCWDCGATDLRCWADDQLGLVAREIGREPILGNREVVRAKKQALRKAATAEAKREGGEIVQHPVQGSPMQKLDRIKELMQKVEQLQAILKSQK